MYTVLPYIFRAAALFGTFSTVNVSANSRLGPRAVLAPFARVSKLFAFDLTSGCRVTPLYRVQYNAKHSASDIPQHFLHQLLDQKRSSLGSNQRVFRM